MHSDQKAVRPDAGWTRSTDAEIEASKSKLSELADAARQAGKSRLDDGLHDAATQVDSAGDALNQAAARLKEGQLEGIAGYTEKAAGYLGGMAERLRSSSVDDLASDARQYARTHPALFIAGSVALGFALTRLLKASRNEASEAYAPDRESSGQREETGYPLGDEGPHVPFATDPTGTGSGVGGSSVGGWSASTGPAGGKLGGSVSPDTGIGGRNG